MLVAVMTLYMAPVVATIGAHFFLNERLNRYSFASIVTVLLGFILVIYQPTGTTDTNTSWFGFLLALTGMACYAGFILINRMIPTYYQEFTKTSWQFLVGALCVLPMIINSELSLTGAQWGWMFLVGLVPGFLGIVLAVYTIKRLPAATFSTISYVEPISAVLLAWVVFQEALSETQIAGCAIIIMASIAQGLKPAKHNKTVSC